MANIVSEFVLALRRFRASISSQPKPHRGVVKWFDDKRGYGFVVPAPTGNKRIGNVFIHASEIKSIPVRLRPGDELEFGIKPTERGPRATNIRVIRAVRLNGS